MLDLQFLLQFLQIVCFYRSIIGCSVPYEDVGLNNLGFMPLTLLNISKLKFITPLTEIRLFFKQSTYKLEYKNEIQRAKMFSRYLHMIPR